MTRTVDLFNYKLPFLRGASKGKTKNYLDILYSQLTLRCLINGRGEGEVKINEGLEIFVKFNKRGWSEFQNIGYYR